MAFNIGDRVRYLGRDEWTEFWSNGRTNFEIGSAHTVTAINRWRGQSAYQLSDDNHTWLYLETQLELIEEPASPVVFDRFMAFRRNGAGELRRSIRTPDSGLPLNELRNALRDQRQTYWIVPLRYVAIIDENGVLTPTIDNL